jgi:hypothetical protein
VTTSRARQVAAARALTAAVAPVDRGTCAVLPAAVLPAAVLAAAVLAVGCIPRAALPGPVWEARFPDADSVRVAELAPGVHHIYLWLPVGPWAVHLLEVDERVCAADVAARKAGPPLAARALTSQLAGDAIAAINADFFMLPGGTPVGAHVQAGRVLVGPGTRHVYAMDRDGGHWAGIADLDGVAIAGTDTARIGQVNRPLFGGTHHPPREGVVLFDAWFGDPIPTGPPGTVVRLRLLEVDDPTAGTATGTAAVVEAAIEVDGPITEEARADAGTEPAPGEALAATEAAMRAVGRAAEDWLERRAVGDTVVWRVELQPTGRDDQPAAEAVGGFPMLVENGRGVYREQTGVIASFGDRRHPRTAVAWDEARRQFFWVVVDGRQPPYSDGMSLPELEWLLLRLQASDAINLDGGGSTAMVVEGTLVNRPSDPTGERPVANVLALEACR